MIPQNDTLNEADQPRYQKNSPPLAPFGPMFTSLIIYIELEGRMMPQNDTLDEADWPSYQKNWSPFWPPPVGSFLAPFGP